MISVKTNSDKILAHETGSLASHVLDRVDFYLKLRDSTICVLSKKFQNSELLTFLYVKSKVKAYHLKCFPVSLLNCAIVLSHGKLKYNGAIDLKDEPRSPSKL